MASVNIAMQTVHGRNIWTSKTKLSHWTEGRKEVKKEEKEGKQVRWKTKLDNKTRKERLKERSEGWNEWMNELMNEWMKGKMRDDKLNEIMKQAQTEGKEWKTKGTNERRKEGKEGSKEEMIRNRQN